MKKYMIAALAAGLVLGTAGCTSMPAANNTFEMSHKLKDGRTVQCLSHNGAGFSCDWSNAK